MKLLLNKVFIILVHVTLNDSLREELGRIDNMIKEHIKKSQLDDGFRNTGGKNNFPKI